MSTRKESPGRGGRRKRDGGARGGNATGRPGGRGRTGAPGLSAAAVLAAFGLALFVLAFVLPGPRGDVGGGGDAPGSPVAGDIVADDAAGPSVVPAGGTAEQYPEPEPVAEGTAGSAPVLPPRGGSRLPGYAGTKGTLIVVIDDAGYDAVALEAFLALPFPVTIAVLPRLPGTAAAVRRTLEAGKELMLHQPMQALNGSDPGPGAILLGMDTDDVRDIVAGNLDQVPGAAGMNNHMGSAATRDPAIMDTVLELAKARGIYYLDSLTTSGTATKDSATRMNLRHWERDVFLDNAPDRTSILHFIDEGKKLASRGKPAVMIGHVWSADLARTLMEVYPSLVAEGYSLSTISRFMMNETLPDPEDEDDADPGN